MANIALVDLLDKELDILESLKQHTLPAAEDIACGAAVRMDVDNGRFTNANGSSAAEARIYGVAVRKVKAGEPVTAIRCGVVDGFDLSGLDYDQAIFLSNTDGRLGDVAGTVSVEIGRVMTVTSNTIGNPHDKVLFIDL